ncbi:ABC transporter substrate-binding protein [Acetobacter malorum]|uniref:CmpA/NrtA family ABC transporter substrate-binding protein n=1 Tax=Acetobacter malorum TaxID=178901 RepID=UPI0039E8546F
MIRHFLSGLHTSRSSTLACDDASSTSICSCGGTHGLSLSRRGLLGTSLAAALTGAVGPAFAATPPGVPEKTTLKIGFVPISCAAPLIMAHARGFFQDEGLTVELQKTAGWALIRDNLLNGNFDASHLLSPMPLALSLGAGHAPTPVRAVTMQNTNGQAITLALKHQNRRDPRSWKGMTFAIPFEFSMHNFLLRAYLAHYGLNPDKDVTLRVTAPPEMVANLKAGNIDGFLGPDPFNQRAVTEQAGFLQILTSQIWDGHPCCALGMTETFIRAHPNTYGAVQRAMIRAAAYMQQTENRQEAAVILARAEYLNQPEIVIRQGLTGHYADGLGAVRNEPSRSGFSPFPYYSPAIWMIEQMKRWGYLKTPVDERRVAEEVFMLGDVRKQAAALALPDLTPPYVSDYPPIQVLGTPFDPAATFAENGKR